METLLVGDSSRLPMSEGGSYGSSHGKIEGLNDHGAAWYLSRRDIEENSPSRRDGIDLKKEAYLRKSYCTFLQDLGMKLKVPQVTIATAIIFCHRFFLRQSHAKNDRRTIATVCMFLAGKVEETPRPLKDVILVSYEIIHKKDAAAVQRIKQKEVYEQQKELTLLGERVVLATLGFDLNVHHPYKPLVEAIKKFKVAQNALAQVAWNFVNDGLRTSLCLQFKPHHIAAGAIFLAAKFLKVKLPSDGEKVWWQEFDVTPRQLEEVSNQMLELYEQNRAATSNGTETEGNSASASSYRAPAKTNVSGDESTPPNFNPHAAATSKHSNTVTSSRSASDHSHTDAFNAAQKATQIEGNDCRAKELNPGPWDHQANNRKDHLHNRSENVDETFNGRESHRVERKVKDLAMSDKGEKNERKESNSGHGEGKKGYSPMVSINKDKVKAALEKRRKSQGSVSRKVELMDDDDLIERELESGIEVPAEDGKNKQEKKPGLLKTSHGQESVDPSNGSDNVKRNGNSFADTSEEGELSLNNCDIQSSANGKRKRKVASPGRQIEGKEGCEMAPHHQLPYSKRRDALEDGMVT